ncbi:hypothetical protein HPB50_007912 [Hyalomma asiaticum]|uniref:Uncharacterized protein n=1 Tax=Hyalomma asiaticum TaxID=266040 RepID=A0ACB7TDW1_HYAAI|nr:hypothetical protein HPB50_007912 [Hyalomma asiaticum]
MFVRTNCRWASPSRVRNARRSNRLLSPAQQQRRLSSGRRQGRKRSRSRRWSSRASSGGGLETSSLAVASAELAAGGRVVAAVSVPVGSGCAAHGAAEAAQSPSVEANSPGPAISGGGPSSLNPARSRLAGPGRELAAVEGMAGLTWSDQETYELIRIWAADRDLLDGTSRNNKVYESMAAQMRSLGYLRTALQVKEKMKRLRKEYKYGKRSKKIATYHDALATVLAQGSKGGSLFIKSEVDESMGSEEFAGTDSETNYMEDGKCGMRPWGATRKRAARPGRGATEPVAGRGLGLAPRRHVAGPGPPAERPLGRPQLGRGPENRFRRVATTCQVAGPRCARRRRQVPAGSGTCRRRPAFVEEPLLAGPATALPSHAFRHRFRIRTWPLPAAGLGAGESAAWPGTLSPVQNTPPAIMPFCFACVTSAAARCNVYVRWRYISCVERGENASAAELAAANVSAVEYFLLKIGQVLPTATTELANICEGAATVTGDAEQVAALRGVPRQAPHEVLRHVRNQRHRLRVVRYGSSRFAASGET